MKKHYLLTMAVLTGLPALTQSRKLAVIGTATTFTLNDGMVQFDHENAKAILLHPNPLNDLLQATVYESDIQIMISTPNGKTVRRIYLDKGINMINVSNLTAGMYYITVYKKQKRLGTQKLIKM